MYLLEWDDEGDGGGIKILPIGGAGESWDGAGLISYGDGHAGNGQGGGNSVVFFGFAFEAGVFPPPYLFVLAAMQRRIEDVLAT
jgi:preprotein translocase subunit Sec61beta